MKALVTGGAGFIGSHLAEALCRRGAKVVVLDDLSLGSTANLTWKSSGDALELVEGDAGDAALLAQIVPGCDWVFHHAAMPSVPRSVAEPVESNRQNLDATLRLLVAARDAGVKRFLFASSSAIYGDAPVERKVETLPPAPLSPYALQKYAAEKYCQMFHALYGLPTVAFRYFNVFGPRQAFDSPYSGVIARFCTAMLHGEAPVIYGDGRQSRDFTYVENVVNANLLAVEADTERVAGQVFNCAAGRSVNLLEVVGALNRLTGQQLEPRFEPARAGDIRHSLADISRVSSVLGYQVGAGWETGLARTLDWYRSSPSAPQSR
jgi:nucleoside-diphosphate-sugar epimerase